MSKILIIGAAGLIGGEVVKALGERECIRASRNSGERVDISDPKSLAALFDRVGGVDGIVCTGGAARYKPWDQLTDEDWTFSLANKLLGQVNVVRYGIKSVRSGGAITLTTGLAAQFPSPGSAIITTVNAAVEAFVRGRPPSRRLPCGSMPFRRVGFQRRCRRWVAIRRTALRPLRWPRLSFASFARARRARLPQRARSERTFATLARLSLSATRVGRIDQDSPVAIFPIRVSHTRPHPGGSQARP